MTIISGTAGTGLGLLHLARETGHRERGVPDLGGEGPRVVLPDDPW